MKRALVSAALLSFLLVAGAGIQWDTDTTLKLTEPEAAACAEADSCFVFTKAELAAMLAVHEMGVRDRARKECLMGDVGRDL